jgi:hypothetical protein
MIPEQHPDPFNEAVHSAARDAKRLAAVTIALGRVLVHHKLQQDRIAAERSAGARRLMQAKARAEMAAARAQWSPANDPAWLRNASLTETAQAWAAAVPYADPATDQFVRSAQTAVVNTEARLRDLHPYAMSRYDRLRADGLGPAEAMAESVHLFTHPARAYEQGSTPRAALGPGDGLGHSWAAAVHGPNREEFEAEQRKQRATRIAEAIDDPDERRAHIEQMTNLRPADIRDLPAAAPKVPRSRQPWTKDFPFPITEVLAAAAAKRNDQPEPAPIEQPLARPAHRGR